MSFNTSVNNRFYNQPVTPTATSYAALAKDVIIEVTNTSAARTITLPAPSATGNVGKAFIIQDSSGGAATNNITIAPVSGLIDGTARTIIAANYGSVQVYCDGTNYYTYGTPSVGSGIYQVNELVITSSGTYTPTAGMLYCEVQMVGGGGGGGGAPATSASQYSGGAGGGGGEYAVGFFSAAQIGSSQSVTIGAAGTVSAGAAGGNGGTTSLGSLMSAFGGVGGASAGPNPGAGYLVGTLGGSGGAGGSYRTAGYPGGGVWFNGIASGTSIAMGNGGSSPLGAGGVNGINAAGSAALGYGAGGGGAGNGNNLSAFAGGAGTAGAVFITEYIGGTAAAPIWTAFTTAVSAVGGTPPTATTAIYTSYYMQVGKILFLTLSLSNSGPITQGSGIYLFNLPPGFTINSSIAPFYPSVNGVVGNLGAVNLNGSANSGSGVGFAYDATHYGFFIYASGSTAVAPWSNSFYGFAQSPLYATANLMIPIN